MKNSFLKSIIFIFLVFVFITHSQKSFSATGLLTITSTPYSTSEDQTGNSSDNGYAIDFGSGSSVLNIVSGHTITSGTDIVSGNAAILTRFGDEVTINNHGSVVGSNGDSYDGSTGVILSTGSSVVNYGTITGGSSTSLSNQSGHAVSMDSGSLINKNGGVIEGGSHIQALHETREAIYLSGSGSSLTNELGAVINSDGLAIASVPSASNYEINNQGGINAGIALSGTGITFSNSGTIDASDGRSALVVNYNAEIVSFSNTGTITSDGAFTVEYYEDQDIAHTNSGNITNTKSSGGVALRFYNEGQTETFTNDVDGNISTIDHSSSFAVQTIVAIEDFQNDGIINAGSLGTAIYSAADFKLTNSGTITGKIDSAGGVLEVINSGGIIGDIFNRNSNIVEYTQNSGGSLTGDISFTGNSLDEITISAGTLNGDIILQGTLEKTLSNAGTVNGQIAVNSGILNFTNSGSINEIGSGWAALYLDAYSQITSFSNTGSITSDGVKTVYYGIATNIAQFNNGNITNTSNRDSVSTDSYGNSALYFAADQTETFTNGVNGNISVTDNSNSNAIVAHGVMDDFQNLGTINAGSSGNAILAINDFKLTNSSTGVINGGIAGGYSNTVLDVTNSGSITGDISFNSSGDNKFNQSVGSFTGDISFLGDGSHQIEISGGTVDGDISLGGYQSLSFDMSGGSVTGDVSLGSNSTNSVNISGNSNIEGTLYVGRNTATVNISAGSGEEISLYKLSSIGATYNISGSGNVAIESGISDFSGSSNSSIIKNGSGTLTASSSQGVSGSLTLNAGTLDLNQSTLFLGASSTASAGTVIRSTSGYSDGTIYMIRGDFILADGVIIDLIAIDGEVNAGDQITLIDNNSTQSNADASNIIVTENSARLNVRLSVDGGSDGFDTVINWVIPALGLSKTSASINDIATNAFSGDSALLTALNGITTTSDLEKALKTLAPDVSGGAIIAAASALSSSLSTIENHQLAMILQDSISGIATGNKANNISAWGEVFGATAKQGLRKGVNGYEADTSGFTLGFDKQINDKLTAGLAVSYSKTNIDSANGVNNNSEVDSYQSTLYSTYKLPKKYFLNSSLAYSRNEYQSSRNVVVSSVNRNALADYSGDQYSAKLQVGKNYKIADNFMITPTASIQYVNLRLDNYSETQAQSANLKVDGQSYNLLTNNISAKVSKKYKVNGFNSIIPELHVGYSYEALNEAQSINVQFTSGNAFTAQGADPANHSYNIGAGVKILTKKDLELTATYDYSAKKDYSSHAGIVNGRFRF